MNARLLLICHGATAATRAAAFPADEPLDAAGEAATASLAGTFGRHDSAQCGPSLRTRQTAAALGLVATPEPALRDIGLGRWAGQAIAMIDPSAVATWTTDPTAAPHGGETFIDLMDRVRPWLAAQAQKKQRAVAITHAAVMRAAILLAIKAEPASFWHIDIGPLCRVDLRANDGAWRLRGIRQGQGSALDPQGAEAP